MSTVSLCTIGAIASKKASAFSSVSSRMASASGAEVRGPVATITLFQSAGGRPVISARSISIRGCASKRPGDSGRKALAIDRQRAAGRHLVGVGRAHDQRTEPPHLGMQQPHGIVGGIVGAEGIGADQLGQAVGAMCLGHPDRPHLVQHDAAAGFSGLPGCLRAGETGADDVDQVVEGVVMGRRVSAFLCDPQPRNDNARSRSGRYP